MLFLTVWVSISPGIMAAGPVGTIGGAAGGLLYTIKLMRVCGIDPAMSGSPPSSYVLYIHERSQGSGTRSKVRG